MDAFDFADYRGLLPRKVQRWIGGGVLAVAVLAPTKFQAWYLHQAQVHAQHLTDECADLMTPAPTEPPSAPASKDRTG